MSEIQEVINSYYEQENLRRAEWIEETMRDLVPDVLYMAYKQGKAGAEDIMRGWFKENEYKMEISPDNMVIQVWKGKDQIAQYQTILPKFIEFMDGNALQNARLN